jgi:signal peptidase I
MNFDFALLLVVLSGITGVVWLIDALFFNKARLAENPPIKDPVPVEYAKSFFPVLFAILLIRSFVYEPFKIPSGSMIPTFHIGDFILVNKFAYGMRLPVLNNKIIAIGEPKRGDIIVFRYPGGSRMGEAPPVGTPYVKRCVGLPGDKIAFFNHQLSINGVPVSAEEIGPYSSKGLGQTGKGFRGGEATLLFEHLPGRDHQALWFGTPNDPTSLDGEWTVPDNMYFAMGDNRDNSADSRDWGFVPEENLMGRADLIWMNFDSERPGWVAWNRLFTKPR